MPNVVQFASIPEFAADLAAGEVAAIYHDLIDQRISAMPSIGISRWLLTSVFRALIANGKIIHCAMLTFPHGKTIERMGEKIIIPNDETTNQARWDAARAAHDLLTQAVRDALAPHSLYNTPMLAGLLHVPDDVPMIFAQEPARVAVAEFLAEEVAGI